MKQELYEENKDLQNHQIDAHVNANFLHTFDINADNMKHAHLYTKVIQKEI